MEGRPTRDRVGAPDRAGFPGKTRAAFSRAAVPLMTSTSALSGRPCSPIAMRARTISPTHIPLSSLTVRSECTGRATREAVYADAPEERLRTS